MLTYAALAVGLIAILMAWSANRKNKESRERIAQVNSRIFDLRREMQETQEKAEYEMLRLKFELLKLQGNLQVTGEMKIGEVLALHPQVEQVLAGFHIGGCSGCMVDDKQSLSEAANLYERQLEPILVALNNLVVESTNGEASPEQLRTPNVQLQF